MHGAQLFIGQRGGQGAPGGPRARWASMSTTALRTPVRSKPTSATLRDASESSAPRISPEVEHPSRCASG